jgi:DNA mismatch endonuclease (patch repair protein)
MTDFLTKAQRSERMSRIRGRDTKPELVLRKLLHAQGLRYRLHRADLPGKPDLVFVRHKAVVFVHGCFWHRHHGCSIATTPKSNIDFWVEKFDRNVARDRRNILALQALGWRVYVVWECELASVMKAKAAADRLALSIVEPSPHSRIRVSDVGHAERSGQRE